MNTVVQLNFDYGTLAPETAIEVRAAAERIKVRMKRTVEDIIEIGRELTEVKIRLEHGRFEDWLKAEFEITDRTAQRIMGVTERFGNKTDNLSLFKPSMLYALAAPSTPDAVVEHALEKAEAGEKVTLAEVQDWKAAAAEKVKQVKAWLAQGWTQSQLERRQQVEEGITVVASQRTGEDGKPVDAALIAWADQQGLMVPIDRKTEWGNPFAMGADGDRDTVCDNYATHYLPYKPSLQKKIPQLAGKVLVCWCHPDRCHSDHLASLANRHQARIEKKP